MAVDEEQDSSPLAPLENQEETTGNHTSNLFPVEDDIDGDHSLHPDTTPLDQQPTHPVIEEQETIANPIDVDMRDGPNGDDTDLLFRIRGLYRLLDLINEQGSGGAGQYDKGSIVLHYRDSTHCHFKVDKVIIAQESVARFMNDICPSAYTSMTKVSTIDSKRWQ